MGPSMTFYGDTSWGLLWFWDSIAQALWGPICSCEATLKLHWETNWARLIIIRLTLVTPQHRQPAYNNGACTPTSVHRMLQYAIAWPTRSKICFIKLSDLRKRKNYQ